MARGGRATMAGTGRSISMFSLITDDILEPGDNVLTFDYLGKRYTASLLPEGTIQWNGHIFASPYAWASHCKNLINPNQKTAIGWGHIRYKGIKLSQYKNTYMKKNRLIGDQDEIEMPKPPTVSRRGRRRRVVTEVTGHEMMAHDAANSLAPLPTTTALTGMDLLGNTVPSPPVAMATAPQESEVTHQAALSLTSELVECVAFEAIEEEQPFDVIISSNVLLLMDFHCHWCWAEVVGYLAGNYVASTNTLHITQVFPCRCNTLAEDDGAKMEKEIQEKISRSNLQLVGWYHSHPSNEATPSLNDVTQQLVYQESSAMDNKQHPCIAIVTSPNLASRRLEVQSSVTVFWVKRRDEMHASPMAMKYTVEWEQYLTQNMVDEMNAVTGYYLQRQDSVNFKAQWRESVPFVHKLKTSLAAFQPKFPQDNSEETFFQFIEQLVFRTQ